MAVRSHIARGEPSPAHPAGAIRLGLDHETNRHFDLKLPDDIASHVFLPGASGTGKTTTIGRVADGALANGHGVVIVDCKAGSLRQTAEHLADRYNLAFNLVDPDDPDTLGYNPCSGDAAEVANKLVGAFTYSPAAEIYKNIGMEAVPVVVRGLFAADHEPSLEALHDAFATRGFAALAQEIDADDAEAERARDRLLSLDTRDPVMRNGYAGMRTRIGALLQGKFGEVFRQDEALDWAAALTTPSVTYIALSTLASGEDVELMGRVVAQDLKQRCHERIRRRSRGEDVTPVLAVFDEFAALREAEQMSDLLLQAREARMPTVISTQYIPATPGLNRAVLGAGLFICHRVDSQDAQALADQFGTRTKNEVTKQIDYETGYSQKGSTRRVDAFVVHPNELRTFPVGVVALKSVVKARTTIASVYPDSLAA
jgi:hypothetical protein